MKSQVNTTMEAKQIIKIPNKIEIKQRHIQLVFNINKSGENNPKIREMVRTVNNFQIIFGIDLSNCHVFQTSGFKISTSKSPATEEINPKPNSLSEYSLFILEAALKN